MCMPRRNFIVYFFLEIFHFKKSCNLIDQKHFSPYLANQNFARNGIGGKKLIPILVFILDYFHEKLIQKMSFSNCSPASCHKRLMSISSNIFLN